MRRLFLPALLLSCAWAGATPAVAAQCYGTAGDGRIAGSVPLPAGGANFSAYSRAGVDAGRTFVHPRVAEIVVAAYAALATADPALRYVYGETGLAAGGPIPPHRTHQNGTSVDFFVPVRDGAGRPARLPADAGNRYGYDIEFDAQARFGEYTLDFPALAEHLYRLDLAAAEAGAGLVVVIFDRAYLEKLFATERGEYLRTHLDFARFEPWVRHDEHYHVDFAIPCRPALPSPGERG